MKNILTATFLTCLCITGNAQINHGYPIDPVPFTSVKVTDSFWGQRLQASREVTIPLAFSKCEETGRYENFIKAAHPSDTYKVEGQLMITASFLQVSLLLLARSLMTVSSAALIISTT